jgi:hypothetical protein
MILFKKPTLKSETSTIFNHELYSMSGRQLPYAVLDTFYLILGWFRQLKCAFFELSLQHGAQGGEDVPEGSALMGKKCNRINNLRQAHIN